MTMKIQTCYYLWSWSLISQPKKIISFTVCSKMAWKVNPIMSAMGIWKRRIMKKQKSLCPASLRHCLLPSYLTSTSSICKSQYDHEIHMPYKKKVHWMLHNYFETFKKKQMAVLILKGNYNCYLFNYVHNSNTKKLFDSVKEELSV